MNNESQFRDIRKDIIVFHNKNEIPYISAPHLHSQYEIYYNISGARGFMLNGNFYKCSEKDLIIIPKVQTHKAIVNKNSIYERCIINIDSYVIELLEILCHSQSTFSWLTSESVENVKTANLSEEEHTQFMELVYEYNNSKDKDKVEMLDSFLKLMLFLKKAFAASKKTDVLDESGLSYSDRVMNIIEHNFKTITVSEIANEIFVSEDYLNRLFKEETGQTIGQYLIMRKLAEAKKNIYLGKSVKEASILSGFRDYSNFIRTFKKYEGYSPSGLDGLTEPI